MTNKEVIGQRLGEILSNFLAYGTRCDGCLLHHEDVDGKCNNECETGIKEWLESEVEK